jgi:UDP-N-acetylmuramoylalanine--D-glutamate ligase
VRIEGGRFTLRGEHLGETSAAAHLPGFQHDNLLLALAAARLLGAPAALLAASLPTLHGLAHRLEDLGQLAERRVYDNGVSTTPDSTQAALRALSSDDSPLTLIAGGRAKSLPIDDLLATAAAQARHVVLFGACAESWSARFRDSNSPCEVTTTTTLAEAVRAAWSASAEGDTILFSPAAASFDAYDNFRQRAEDFCACVRSQVRAAAASTTP